MSTDLEKIVTANQFNLSKTRMGGGERKRPVTTSNWITESKRVTQQVQHSTFRNESIPSFLERFTVLRHQYLKYWTFSLTIFFKNYEVQLVEDIVLSSFIDKMIFTITSVPGNTTLNCDLTKMTWTLKKAKW